MSYYGPYNTLALELALCTQLETYCRERYGRKLSMDFAFEAFPPHFDWGKYTGWETELNVAEQRDLVEAFSGRQPVNQP